MSGAGAKEFFGSTKIRTREHPEGRAACAVGRASSGQIDSRYCVTAHSAPAVGSDAASTEAPVCPTALGLDDLRVGTRPGDRRHRAPNPGDRTAPRKRFNRACTLTRPPAIGGCHHSQLNRPSKLIQTAAGVIARERGPGQPVAGQRVNLHAQPAGVRGTPDRLFIRGAA